MKNKWLYLVGSLFLCTSCSVVNFLTPKASILKEPSKFRGVVKGENFSALAQNVREFSANFSFESGKELDNKENNYAVSPLSMFSALAVASACANGNTKQELLDALKTDDALLENEFANLFEAANFERSYGGNDKHLIKKEELTNSLWLNKNVEFKQSMLDLLAEKFYSYSVQVDYLRKNKQANRQMSKFVEEKTNGLLNPNFNFDIDTALTILNTLYLKSLWNDDSENITISEETYDFVNRDKSITKKNLFETNYQPGKIIRTEKYSSFFAGTYCGDRIKFVVPNDGVNLEDLINPETILEINNQEYEGYIEETNTQYFGKTYFPGFESECEMDAKKIVKSMGVNDFFVQGVCNFSPLTDNTVWCDQIIHATKLKVDKKGIEGAAYTAIAMKGEMAPEPPDYTEIFEDFIVDKSFYYVVCDHNNLPLFSGVVNKI